ncbi:MAG: hypothetical protein GY803_03520 [Chloroflexi bacterium]|nr:hypothetical protein [Chloroflexota bacterium]
MFETKTTWQDSGHDCEHCGGEVLKRTDGLPNGVIDVFLQCRDCGCQWAEDGEWLRVGNGRSCQTAHRQQTNPAGWASRRLFIALGVLLLLVIARLGGMGALRYLLPLAIAGLVAWTVMRLGREFEWW